MKLKTNYQVLCDKWANRSLYSTPYDINSASVGRINVYKCDDYTLEHIKGFKVVADVWELPKLLGWENEKQKKDFIKEAKKAGLSFNKKTKNEMYKIIDLIKY
jgi:hypothetical protein